MTEISGGRGSGRTSAPLAIAKADALGPLEQVGVEAYEIATLAGWHQPREIDGTVRTASAVERVALIMTEACELIEELRRDPDPASFYTEVDGKPEGAAAELADIVIRCCEYAAIHGIPLDRIVEQKMAYNRTRSVRHGGKLL